MRAAKLDGRSIWVAGQEYLYFGNTSYLNLPYEEIFQEFIAQGMSLYGSSRGSSPKTTPTLAIYEQLESYLASYYGFPDALLFSSGHSASQALMKLVSQSFEIKYGPFAHAALRLSNTIVGNMWPEGTPKLWANDFIDPISLQRVDRLESMPNSTIAVDTSHGFGVLDKELIAFAEKHKALVCGSLNKGLGIHAGVVLCDSATKTALRDSIAYQSSSSASPALCFALLNAFESGFIQAQQQKLNSLLGLIAKSALFTNHPPFPVCYISKETNLYESLMSNNILLWKGGYGDMITRVNRLVICAGHKESDLIRLIECINKL